ncbi:MAG: lipoprotein [Candidatus Komeilibacteria bacterium]|nr:lipoprotein [Candidatus Komeilibacteria bacterium]
MKKIIITLGLILALAGCATTAPVKPTLDVSKLNMQLEAQLAQDEANKVYQKAVKNKLDLSKGPCLSNTLYGNEEYPETLWILDIVHNPRTAADDDPANQCSAYLTGKARNFIEMDPAGNILRVYSPLLKNN